MALKKVGSIYVADTKPKKDELTSSTVICGIIGIIIVYTLVFAG